MKSEWMKELEKKQGCHYISEIARNYGWDSRTISQLAWDSGIRKIRKRIKHSERFFTTEEYSCMKLFIKTPEFGVREKFYGGQFLPKFLRIT